MQRTQSTTQSVTQSAIKMHSSRERNPLCILVPGDDDTPSTACSSCGGGSPNSPWPQIDEVTQDSNTPPLPSGTDPRVLFEKAAAAFNQAKPRWDMISREEGWQKEAPSKFVYNGKRNKKGMPDKRTAAGKEWFQKQREEELKTALRKVINKCNSWPWRGSK